MRVIVDADNIGNLVYKALIDKNYMIDDAVIISEIVEQLIKENEDD